MASFPQIPYCFTVKKGRCINFSQCNLLGLNLLSRAFDVSGLTIQKPLWPGTCGSSASTLKIGCAVKYLAPDTGLDTLLARILFSFSDYGQD